MKIVIAGPKGAGKSTVGERLAQRLGLPAIETDRLIEEQYLAETGSPRTCREIYRHHGEEVFRDRERQAVMQAAALDWCVVITGGSTLLAPDSRRALRRDAILIYLEAEPDLLWERVTAGGIPPWHDCENGKNCYAELVLLRGDIVRPYADILLKVDNETPDALADRAMNLIAEELAVRCRAANTLGELIRVTTFGESHGKAVGAVLDGIAPGIPLTEADIQAELDRRRPGQSRVTTQRKESDTVHILSGVFEGKTTGAPIAMIIYNEDQDSSKYETIRDLFRPGHADFTFYRKYGLRDHRGGGRSSGRETATRVAAGAVARKVLMERGVRIVAHAVEIAGIVAATCDYDEIERNPVRCADAVAAKAMEEAIIRARKERDSVGGVIQLEITGVPAGLGDPVFGKLSARLAGAIMSIGAIKGVEIGGGFQLARLRGSEANDPMRDGGFVRNHAGGILGGISTGEPIVLRVAVKPTSSIAQPQETIDLHGTNQTIEVHGRHDPCIVPRAVPVVEHMAALVLLDAWEVQTRLRPDWPPSKSSN